MNFNIPSNFNSDVASNTTSMMASIGHPVELIIGILLAFLIIRMLIALFRGESTTEAAFDGIDEPEYD